MSAEEAMKMCENGDATIIYGDVIFMRSKVGYYISVDGIDWEETDSELVKKQFE